MSGAISAIERHWYGDGYRKPGYGEETLGIGQTGATSEGSVRESNEGNTGVVGCGRSFPVAINAQKNRGNPIISASQGSIRLQMCELRDIRVLGVLLENIAEAGLPGVRWVEIRGYAEGLEESFAVRDVLFALRLRAEAVVLCLDFLSIFFAQRSDCGLGSFWAEVSWVA